MDFETTAKDTYPPKETPSLLDAAERALQVEMRKADRRFELLREANEDNTNGYLTTGKCPFCEMLWYDGWHHHVDCRLEKELSDDTPMEDME